MQRKLAYSLKSKLSRMDAWQLLETIMKILSNSKRAKEMRKMRREESPKERAKRLRHRRKLLNAWKKRSVRDNKP